MADNDDERKIGDNVHVDQSMPEATREGLAADLETRAIGKRIRGMRIAADGVIIALEGGNNVYFQGSIDVVGVATTSDQPPGVEPEPVEEPPYTIQ